MPCPVRCYVIEIVSNGEYLHNVAHREPIAPCTELHGLHVMLYRLCVQVAVPCLRPSAFSGSTLQGYRHTLQPLRSQIWKI